MMESREIHNQSIFSNVYHLFGGVTKCTHTHKYDSFHSYAYVYNTRLYKCKYMSVWQRVKFKVTRHQVRTVWLAFIIYKYIKYMCSTNALHLYAVTFNSSAHVLYAQHFTKSCILFFIFICDSVHFFTNVECDMADDDSEPLTTSRCHFYPNLSTMARTTTIQQRPVRRTTSTKNTT